jgi:hypothetical protein
VILVITLLQLEAQVSEFCKEKQDLNLPKNTMDMGIYSALFFCCIVEKTLGSSSTLPSMFLPDHTEPYPLKMKLHPSLLLNKYAHSFQTKPHGHM